MGNMIEKAYAALNKLLVEIWALMTLLDSEGSEEQDRENIYHIAL